jgi:hypothetical protein
MPANCYDWHRQEWPVLRLGGTRAVTFCNGWFFIVLGPCYIVIDNGGLSGRDSG